ncbi:MAG: PilZ domain-containing protein [Cellvibrionales bacterium]|nr:PilZ domain-containing protein [Cellvibrionales bacterium]
MDIQFQRPSHRLHHRLNAPLNITIEGKTYKSINWSLGGFSIPLEVDATFEVDDTVQCKLSIPFQGFEVSFKNEAKIVRVDSTMAQVGAQFIDLDKRQHDILKYFTEELVRGSMTSIREAIIRIDTPVTPVSAEPDANPQDEIPVSRWNMKNIVRFLAYSLSGIMLFTYFGITFYYNYFVLEVDTALMFARIEKVVSSANGKIKKTHFELEQMAKEGDTLFTIDDPTIAEKLALADIQVGKIQARLDAQRNRMKVENKKMDDFANFAVLEMERAKKELNASKVLVKLANKEVQRLKTLKSDSLASQTELDEALGKLTLAYSKQQTAEVDLQQKEEILAEVDRGYFFTGTNLIGSTNEYQVEVKKLSREIEIAQKEKQVLVQHQADLEILAPDNGRFLEFFFPEGSSVKQGDIMALYERDQKRMLHVYVTQEDVLSLEIGTPATIYFPSIDKRVEGRVYKIDRTGGVGDEAVENFAWMSTETKVLVKVDIHSISQDEIRELLPHGLPAMVMFTSIQKGMVGRAVRSYLIQKDGEG